MGATSGNTDSTALVAPATTTTTGGTGLGMSFLQGALGGVLNLVTGTPQPIQQPPIPQAATPGKDYAPYAIAGVALLIIMVLAIFWARSSK